MARLSQRTIRLRTFKIEVNPESMDRFRVELETQDLPISELSLWKDRLNEWVEFSD